MISGTCIDWGACFPGNSAGKESACKAGDPSLIPGLGRCLGKDRLLNPVFSGFPGGSDCKESACNAGDLFWEDPLEEAIHSSILAWRIPMDRGAGLLWGHKEPDMTEQLSTYIQRLP